MNNIKLAGDWQKVVQQAATTGLNDIARDYQRMFDRLSRQYAGRPVEQIKPILRREWARVGGSISDPELTDYAENISEGTRIQIKVDPIKF